MRLIGYGCAKEGTAATPSTNGSCFFYNIDIHSVFDPYPAREHKDRKDDINGDFNNDNGSNNDDNDNDNNNKNNNNNNNNNNNGLYNVCLGRRKNLVKNYLP